MYCSSTFSEFTAISGFICWTAHCHLVSQAVWGKQPFINQNLHFIVSWLQRLNFAFLSHWWISKTVWCVILQSNTTAHNRIDHCRIFSICQYIKRDRISQLYILYTSKMDTFCRTVISCDKSDVCLPCQTAFYALREFSLGTMLTLILLTNQIRRWDRCLVYPLQTHALNNLIKLLTKCPL